MDRKLTIHIDEETYRRAESVASVHDLSINSWVEELVRSNIPAGDELEAARQRALSRIKVGWKLGGTPVARETLHER